LRAPERCVAISQKLKDCGACSERSEESRSGLLRLRLTTSLTVTSFIAGFGEILLNFITKMRYYSSGRYVSCGFIILFFLTTDGSKYSEAATESAINFAKSYGGELMVLSVVEVTEEFLARAPEIVEDMVKKAKGFVEDVRKKAEEYNIKTTSFVREGETYKIITNFAREQKADIIFMGSHGRSGITKLFMGSVTERVIGHAKCAVLVWKL
jgi:nucleotide-binding universal stress UspA family protein